VQALKKRGPERIVYVSCNPATQARDVALLLDDYALERVQPVDLFPHSPHVESAALLVRRDAAPGAS
jgi:23S rRNA (uracil1939-C5)-methyltransferase